MHPFNLIFCFVLFFQKRKVAEKDLNHIDIGQTHAINIGPHPDDASLFSIRRIKNEKGQKRQ